MALVYRHFNENDIIGDVGNISVYYVKEGRISVTIFGLNRGYNYAFMIITYPIENNLYETCKVILDTITESFHEITHEGHIDYILLHPDNNEIKKEHAHLLQYKRNSHGYIKMDFTDQNINYLKEYSDDSNVSVSPPYRLLGGEVTTDGKFIYDKEAYLHCEDDFSNYETDFGSNNSEDDFHDDA
jgi:hypothetical protein